MHIFNNQIIHRTIPIENYSIKSTPLQKKVALLASLVFLLLTCIIYLRKKNLSTRYKKIETCPPGQKSEGLQKSSSTQQAKIETPFEVEIIETMDSVPKREKIPFTFAKFNALIATDTTLAVCASNFKMTEKNSHSEVIDKIEEVINRLLLRKNANVQRIVKVTLGDSNLQQTLLKKYFSIDTTDTTGPYFILFQNGTKIKAQKAVWWGSPMLDEDKLVKWIATPAGLVSSDKD